MIVEVYNRQKALKVSKASVIAIVKAILEKEGVECDEVIVHFVNTKRICELHKQFFNDPSPTDCITFPIDDSVLGEIFICTDTAVQYAKKHKVDQYQELTLYLVHGLLHLLGYDDIKSTDRRVMRKKEKSCMEFLKSLSLRL